jgi:hypothetical protein
MLSRAIIAARSKQELDGVAENDSNYNSVRDGLMKRPSNQGMGLTP